MIKWLLDLLSPAGVEKPFGKRPFAFRVKRGDEWILFDDENAAREFADEMQTDYQGLYVRDGTAAAEAGTRDLTPQEQQLMHGALRASSVSGSHFKGREAMTSSNTRDGSERTLSPRLNGTPRLPLRAMCRIVGSIPATGAP